MRGGYADPLYVAARTVLLDALSAIRTHLPALVVVGAQAIYLRTGTGGLEVPPYTTDADLALDPDQLGPEPRIEITLRNAGFTRHPTEIGIWKKRVSSGESWVDIPVDLLVPASMGGPGRRSARIPPHEQGVARKVAGLEAALVDHDPIRVASLEDSDQRSFQVQVAGPGALLVAKTHKLVERLDDANRLSDKDALDLLRLLRGSDLDDVAARLRRLLNTSAASQVTKSAVDGWERLFRTPASPGSQMAARAAAGAEPGEVVAASLSHLAMDLRLRLGGTPG